MRNWPDMVSALVLLVGASVAHALHCYIFSIPVSIVAIIMLGIILKEELGL